MRLVVWGAMLVAMLVAAPMASAAAPGVKVHAEVDAIAKVTVDSDGLTSGDGNPLDHVVLRTALRDDGIAVGDVATVAIETPEWFTAPVVHATSSSGHHVADAIGDPLAAPRATGGDVLRAAIDTTVDELAWARSWITTAHDRLTPILDRLLDHVLAEAGAPTCLPGSADVCWSDPASRPRVAFSARNATLATAAGAWEYSAAEGHRVSHDAEDLTPARHLPASPTLLMGVHRAEATTGEVGRATATVLHEGSDDSADAHDGAIREYKTTRDDIRSIIGTSKSASSTTVRDDPSAAASPEETGGAVDAPSTSSHPLAPTSAAAWASDTGRGGLGDAKTDVAGDWSTASGGVGPADDGHDARTTVTFGAAGMAVSIVFALFSRLYTRIRDALAHDGRARLMEVLRASPGLGATALAERAGMTRSTVRYHLGRLVADGHVVARKFGGWPVYHVNGAPAARDASAARAALAHPATARVHAALEAEPTRSVRDLARRVGLSVGGVHHHVQKLRAAGLARTA